MAEDIYAEKSKKKKQMVFTIEHLETNYKTLTKMIDNITIDNVSMIDQIFLKIKDHFNDMYKKLCLPKLLSIPKRYRSNLINEHIIQYLQLFQVYNDYLQNFNQNQILKILEDTDVHKDQEFEIIKIQNDSVSKIFSISTGEILALAIKNKGNLQKYQLTNFMPNLTFKSQIHSLQQNFLEQQLQNNITPQVIIDVLNRLQILEQKEKTEIFENFMSKTLSLHHIQLITLMIDNDCLELIRLIKQDEYFLNNGIINNQQVVFISYTETQYFTVNHQTLISQSYNNNNHKHILDIQNNIQQLSSFLEASPKFIKQILPYCEKITITVRQKLIKYQTAQDYIFGIIDGQVQIQRNNQIITQITKNSCIGEESIFSYMLPQFDYIVVTSGHAIKIGLKQFLENLPKVSFDRQKIRQEIYGNFIQRINIQNKLYNAKIKVQDNKYNLSNSITIKKNKLVSLKLDKKSPLSKRSKHSRHSIKQDHSLLFLKSHHSPHGRKHNQATNHSQQLENSISGIHEHNQITINDQTLIMNEKTIVEEENLLSRYLNPPAPKTDYFMKKSLFLYEQEKPIFYHLNDNISNQYSKLHYLTKLKSQPEQTLQQIKEDKIMNNNRTVLISQLDQTKKLINQIKKQQKLEFKAHSAQEIRHLHSKKRNEQFKHENLAQDERFFNNRNNIKAAQTVFEMGKQERIDNGDYYLNGTN